MAWGGGYTLHFRKGSQGSQLSHGASTRVTCMRALSEWPTVCSPMDCSPPGSSIHRILQARILEWVAIRFSRGSSRPRDRTQVSHIVSRHFTIWATSCQGIKRIYKKAECWRIDAFELWCWRRLLRVTWTARRSNQSILREINPEYSMEGLMLKLRL